MHLQQQVVQQEQQQKHRQEQNQEQQQYNGRREGAQAANAGHATVQAAAGWPFVQLLDSFTWRGGGDGHGSGSGSGSGPMGASGGAECVGAGGGAARCLVLQQLGPCATDVLSMWREEQDGVQQEGQEGGRGSESCGGARGAVGREAAGGGWRGGLPPCAVKRFARQALWALDLLHRWDFNCVLLLTDAQYAAAYCYLRLVESLQARETSACCRYRSKHQCARVMPHAVLTQVPGRRPLLAATDLTHTGCVCCPLMHGYMQVSPAGALRHKARQLLPLA